MPPGEARIVRLEERLRHGLPWHLSLKFWSEVALARLEDPSVLAALSLDDLDRLGVQVAEMLRAECIEPDTTSAADLDLPMASSGSGDGNGHGRLPMSAGANALRARAITEADREQPTPEIASAS